MAIARVSRKYRHHYGAEELIGRVMELNPGDGTCSFLVDGESRERFVYLAHLTELRDESVNYLEEARARGRLAGRENTVTNTEFIRECALQYRNQRPSSAAPANDDTTLVGLDGDAYLVMRLGRPATEEESTLFWAEVERES